MEQNLSATRRGRNIKDKQQKKNEPVVHVRTYMRSIMVGLRLLFRHPLSIIRRLIVVWAAFLCLAAADSYLLDGAAYRLGVYACLLVMLFILQYRKVCDMVSNDAIPEAPLFSLPVTDLKKSERTKAIAGITFICGLLMMTCFTLGYCPAACCDYIGILSARTIEAGEESDLPSSFPAIRMACYVIFSLVVLFSQLLLIVPLSVFLCGKCVPQDDTTQNDTKPQHKA